MDFVVHISKYDYIIECLTIEMQIPNKCQPEWILEKMCVSILCCIYIANALENSHSQKHMWINTQKEIKSKIFRIQIALKIIITYHTRVHTHTHNHSRQRSICWNTNVIYEQMYTYHRELIWVVCLPKFDRNVGCFAVSATTTTALLLLLLL